MLHGAINLKFSNVEIIRWNILYLYNMLYMMNILLLRVCIVYMYVTMQWIVQLITLDKHSLTLLCL